MRVLLARVYSNTNTNDCQRMSLWHSPRTATAAASNFSSDSYLSQPLGSGASNASNASTAACVPPSTPLAPVTRDSSPLGADSSPPRRLPLAPTRLDVDSDSDDEPDAFTFVPVSHLACNIALVVVCGLTRSYSRRWLSTTTRAAAFLQSYTLLHQAWGPTRTTTRTSCQSCRI